MTKVVLYQSERELSRPKPPQNIPTLTNKDPDTQSRGGNSSAGDDGMPTSEPTSQPIATQPPTGVDFNSVEGPTCNTHTSRREQTANVAAGFVFVVILVFLVAMVVVIVLKLA